MKKSCVLALGFFDSLHIGHRFLLDKAKDMALRKGTELTVLTFDDDFLKFFNKNEKEVYVLSERIDLLKEIGVDNIDVLPSDNNFMNLSKEDFVNKYIIRKYLPLGVVAGADYSFGKNAEGDITYLAKALHEKGIEDILICDLYKKNQMKVATTNIRSLISGGDIESANLLLNNSFFIGGIVVSGKKNGSKMSLPTANIIFNENKIIPKFGVYASMCAIDGKFFKSITNIGGRPTFNDDKLIVETYILDFSGDLYGRYIKIYLKKYLREIQKFDNLELLKTQIQHDISILRGAKDD